MALYELFLIGSPADEIRTSVEQRLSEAAVSFDLAVPDELAVYGPDDFEKRAVKATSAALYFGGRPLKDVELVDKLEEARIPVVPVLTEGAGVADELPQSISATNALFYQRTAEGYDSVAAVALESLGLLRRQRRVFVSYRRNESRSAAVQLHDEMSARGFDVFLDTHDILPGDAFQEMLWHRLADCDVVIMLDTEDYFGSKWTTQELGRSLAQGIQILRIVWPDHTPSRHLNLSETISLAVADLDADGRIKNGRLSEIVACTERLRSKSVASRHRAIASSLKIEVEKLGGTFEGIGSHRAMALDLPNGLKLQAYPAVGVPTAELLNDIHEKASRSDAKRFPCLVYSEIGIRPLWRSHLKWLDEQVKEVRALKVNDAAWELAEWDS